MFSLVRNGGGINILGIFQVSCKIYIADSCSKNNFGLSHGSGIRSALICVTDNTYLIFIQNCIITHNKDRSIVYVGMEHYILPAFLLLNAEFNNNTGTPLQLFIVILVGNGVTRFQNNRADVGAALHLRRSYILLNFTSFQFDMRDNLAKMEPFILTMFLLMHITSNAIGYSVTMLNFVEMWTIRLMAVPS